MGAFLSCLRWLLRPGSFEGDGGLDEANGTQVEATQRSEGSLHRSGNVLEAVFVEGHRSPQEAMQALRAAAGKLGANAIINLTHERTTAGRCTASGDAVLVRPKIEPAASPAPRQDISGSDQSRQDA